MRVLVELYCGTVLRKSMSQMPKGFIKDFFQASRFPISIQKSFLDT